MTDDMKIEVLSKLLKAKTELIILAILVPLVLTLGVILAKWSTWQEIGVPAPSTTSPGLEENQGSAAVEKTITSMESEVAKQAVSLVVENGADKTTVLVPVAGTASVAEVMQTAAAENKITMEYKDYGAAMGILIESINNIANNSGQKRYWYLYVNGQLSPVGASQAQVEAGDVITWKYEEEKDE